VRKVATMLACAASSFGLAYGQSTELGGAQAHVGTWSASGVYPLLLSLFLASIGGPVVFYGLIRFGQKLHARTARTASANVSAPKPLDMRGHRVENLVGTR